MESWRLNDDFFPPVGTMTPSYQYLKFKNMLFQILYSTYERKMLEEHLPKPNNILRPQTKQQESSLGNIHSLCLVSLRTGWVI